MSSNPARVTTGPALSGGQRRAFFALIVVFALISTGCALLGSPTPIPEQATTTAGAAPTTQAPASPTATLAGATSTSEPAATQTSAPPAATATNTPSPPTATAAPGTERISFAAGATQAGVEGQLPASGTARFVLGISGNQFVELSATIGSQGQGLRFSLVGADGTVVKPANDTGPQGPGFFRGVVPTTQDYILTLTGPGGSPYNLGVLIPVRLTFAEGDTSTEVSGLVMPGTARHYVIRALGGQTMTVDITTTSGQISTVVFGADGTVLQSGNIPLSDFSGPLPTTQDYLIVLNSIAAIAANYTMRVTIPPLDEATPVPTTGPAERINFAAGATSAIVEGTLAAHSTKDYVVRIGAGQLLEVLVDPQSSTSLAVEGTDGTVLQSSGGPPFFRATVPTTQDYRLRISTGGVAVNYTVQVIIPVRITFDAGATSATEHATLPPYTTGHFVIRAMAGQTMTLETTTTQGQVILIVYGADGTVLQTDHAGSPSFNGVLPSTQDYLINVRSVGTAAANVTLVVTIPPP